MAVNDHLVTVFGGSGFVGRHVVSALCKAGLRVRVAVRRPDLAGHVLIAGRVGQVCALQANVRHPDSIRRAVDGADLVVNLVGTLLPTGRNTYDAVHVFGASAIARHVQAAGLSLVHVSALGADRNSSSPYAQSKARGEAAVLEALPTAIILRPSIIFGAEDRFFNRFATLARLSPIVPVIGGDAARIQPVFVGDVAEAVAKGVCGHLRAGTTYELGGPQIMSLRDVAELISKVTYRSRLQVGMPFGLARLAGKILQFLPGRMVTPDLVSLLQNGSVVSDEAILERRTLEGMGIPPSAAAAIVAAYLWRFRKAGQFERAAA